MKVKIGLIILIALSISIIGCTSSLKNSSQESYDQLIKKYREKNKIEKLTEVVEAAIRDGYPPEENKIYLEILDYYDSNNNKDKITELMEGSFSQVNLPISIYKEFILRDKLPSDMEVVEMKSGDITHDGKNEIAVLMATPQKGINMNYLEAVRLEVYNLGGEIIYQDQEEGGYFLYPKIAMVDLNNDGVKDLYYNVIYDSITNASTLAKVLSFKDDRIEFIYSDGIDKIDIEIEITSESSYRIYSEEMGISYDVSLEDDKGKLRPGEEVEPIWWEVYERLGKDENGRDIIQTNFEIKGFGMIEVNYSYIEGEIKPQDFKFQPHDGEIK